MLGVHRALKVVVEELSGDGDPDGVGVGVGAVDVVPNFFGDGVVEPRNDAGIDLEPFGVVDHSSGIDGAVDMIGEAELLESELNERAPLPEVAFLGGQHDGDMVTNVEQHEGSSRRWSGISRSGEGIGVGGGRACHGSERRKQWEGGGIVR